MASPATETWWSTWLHDQGRDSEEEAAFNGFLSTNHIPADAGPDVLQTAYTQFVQWMEESEGREADRGPSRADLAKEQAVAELEHQFVAKSRVSAPGVEKPLVAATRPALSREPLAESGVGPAGEAQLAPAGGTPSESRPQVSGEPPVQPQPHATTTRVEEPAATHRPGQAHAEAESREGRGGRRGSGDN